MPDSPAPVIDVQQVSFRYGGTGPDAPGWIVEGVDLRVHPGEFVGLIGPNGGGKTTLLKLILGLIEPTRGSVRLLGGSPARTRHRVGYVPQHARLDPDAPATVLDLVLMGRLHAARWGYRFNHADRDRALAALDRVGVPQLAGRPLQALSGGQRQRALIARALTGDAELLLLDEPVTGIDPKAEAGFVELLNDLRRSLPIVLVSHDIGFVHEHIDRVACLNRSLTIHRTADLTTHHIDHLYHESVVHIAHEHDCPVHGPATDTPTHGG